MQAMGWFPCTDGSRNKDQKTHRYDEHRVSLHLAEKLKAIFFGVRENDAVGNKWRVKKGLQSGTTRQFALRELIVATNNFRPECLLGEGGFGKVYKGRLEETNQVVAVKQLNRDGTQGNMEFLVEVMILGQLHHPNLVNLIGYCSTGDQRLLVYEYMPLGSLDEHLHGSPLEKKRLDWNARVKIAAGAARGLEYLHTKADPPVIYRDLKSSNILLGKGYHAKLSDFGLAKLGPLGDGSHVSTRVMGTYGYCAPEYCRTGQLTPMSDIYSFGVVLLELITGRRAVLSTKLCKERRLVEWVQPMLKDRRKHRMMADPMLRGEYPLKGLYHAITIAAMCVEEEPSSRPSARDLAKALTLLSSPEEPSSQDHPSHLVLARLPLAESKQRQILRSASK